MATVKWHRYTSVAAGLVGLLAVGLSPALGALGGPDPAPAGLSPKPAPRATPAPRPQPAPVQPRPAPRPAAPAATNPKPAAPKATTPKPTPAAPKATTPKPKPAAPKATTPKPAAPKVTSPVPTPEPKPNTPKVAAPKVAVPPVGTIAGGPAAAAEPSGGLVGVISQLLLVLALVVAGGLAIAPRVAAARASGVPQIATLRRHTPELSVVAIGCALTLTVLAL